MFIGKIKRTLILCIVGVVATVGLTGCFKGEVSVDVKPNGSGILSLAIGMTEQAKALVASPDEINKALSGNELFNRFVLTRSHGLLRDEITLDAEFAPMNSNASGNDSGVDPSAFIKMTFSARLPGKIIETNGLTDINDPN